MVQCPLPWGLCPALVPHIPEKSWEAAQPFRDTAQMGRGWALSVCLSSSILEGSQREGMSLVPGG